MLNTITLPPLDASSKLHSDQLLDAIKEEIQKKGGKISFKDYMSHALYAPNLGYYVAGAPKFGPQGDFITAPEISCLFSQCIAQNFLTIQKECEKASILELGAGTGKMAVDIMLFLEKSNALPEKYFILELSADLKERQQQLFNSMCPHLLSKVEWLSQLQSTFNGLIVANEVLDAMPVRRFCIEEGKAYEYYVELKNGQLNSIKMPINPSELSNYHQSMFEKISAYNNYIFEVNDFIEPWLGSMGDMLEKGALLIIDYGFPQHELYHPDRFMGTLMCHYRHHSHSDYFLYPGLQDITAHVDFSHIAEIGSNLKFDLLGFTNQANFLINSELLTLLKDSINTVSEQEKFKLNHAVQMLCSPAEMGELFKVMGLGKKIRNLIGFRQFDQRHRL